jgi:CubicO group peptidase (beta-lactamase class C family)
MDPPITIEELLTHSSGLPREAGSHWTTFDFPTTEQLRGLMAERQAPFSPSAVEVFEPRVLNRRNGHRSV